MDEEKKIEFIVSMDKNLNRFEDIDIMDIENDALDKAKAMELFKLDKGD